jgi:NAD(P)-dependent dehydrogenase (short-subunit alcohol dehydrogenase family)
MQPFQKEARMGDFDGKVALVTGGSSGIGRAAAGLLAARGAAVMIGGRDPDEVSRAAGELSGTVRGMAADVTDAAAVANLVAATVSAYGGVDILVTAAGIQRYGTAADTSADEWDEVLAVNVKGCFLAVKYALPHLRVHGGGSIVIVSSVQAYECQSGVAAYTASKGALNALARSIAIDEAPNGIRANAVCPGSVDTPMLRWAARRFSDGTDAGAQALIDSWGRMHPLGRVASADEVAEVIAFLAGEAASFVTGVGLPVDGGLLAGVPVVLQP